MDAARAEARAWRARSAPGEAPAGDDRRVAQIMRRVQMPEVAPYSVLERERRHAAVAGGLATTGVLPQPRRDRAARARSSCLRLRASVAGAEAFVHGRAMVASRPVNRAMAEDRHDTLATMPGTVHQRAVADRRRRRDEDLSRARGAGAHAQGAGTAPDAAHPPRDLPGAARHLLRRASRRVLRDRRAQRQRQEHAAEVPRRDLRSRQRADLDERPALDVHRARRRLQPGSCGARQRRAQRDHDGALATRGTRALRRGDRLRRTARVRGAEAQELLLGHARAARVLGRDPGRRRDPARRRGARRRRRRLSAEVLRRLQRDARRRTHDRVRDPRHGRAQPLLPPSAAARARRRSSTSASRTRSPTATWRSTSGATRRRRRAARAARGGDGEARVVEAWVEDEHGERQPSLPQGEQRHAEGARAVQGRRRRSGRERIRAQRGARRDRRRDELARERAQRTIRRR